MDPEIKALVEEQAKLFDQFKGVVNEKLLALEKGKPTSEFEGKLAKMETDFGGYEKKLTDATAALETKSLASLETRDKRINDLEARIQRGGMGRGRELERKAFVDHRLWEGASLPDAEKKTQALWEVLRMDDKAKPEFKTLTQQDPETGGYLATPEITNEIIKAAVDITPALQIADVRMTQASRVVFRKRMGTITFVSRSELGTLTERTGLKYGVEEVDLPERYALILATQRDLEDAGWLEGEIAEVMQLAYATKVGAELINGKGVQNMEMEGIAVNGDIASTTSGASGALAPGTMIDCQSALKAGYQAGASWLLRQATLGKIRQMVGGDGHFIWAPGNGSIPNLVLDKPYTISEDVAAVAGSAVPLFYGNFKLAYKIVLRIALDIQRLNEKYVPDVGFYARTRFGGQVVLAEAIKKYTCTA